MTRTGRIAKFRQQVCTSPGNKKWFRGVGLANKGTSQIQMLPKKVGPAAAAAAAAAAQEGPEKLNMEIRHGEKFPTGIMSGKNISRGTKIISFRGGWVAERRWRSGRSVSWRKNLNWYVTRRRSTPGEKNQYGRGQTQNIPETFDEEGPVIGLRNWKVWGREKKGRSNAEFAGRGEEEAEGERKSTETTFT